MLSSFIRQVRDEVAQLRAQLKKARGAYQVQVAELEAQIELFKAAAKNYDRQRDEAV
jgi:hypothetical protein